jgi:NADH dehydrogenase (ubiquinone) Fe-S protein 2
LLSYAKTWYPQPKDIELATEYFLQPEYTDGKKWKSLPSNPDSLKPPIGKPQNILLNFGPQHPAAHGVLRLILELDGEVCMQSNG